MKSLRTWIVLADGANARFLLNSGRGKGLEPLPDGQMGIDPTASRDIGTERPGRVHDRMGPGRHAMAPKVDWHEQQKTEFLGEVASRLNAAVQEQALDQLVLVAPPKALGELRAALAKQTAERVTAELAKDLLNVPEAELSQHLEQLITL